MVRVWHIDPATEVEGVFRINGSEKRMKELKQQFDTPPEYGKDIDWEGYNVHDAATLLRRFLNLMPEPIIPVDRYSDFCSVLAKPNVDENEAIASYRKLITSCPHATQYLLLYILDLLAVFERMSEVNLMTANNLAIIFQPGMLSHPSLSSKEEHHIAVQVVEFLIIHQDHFVLALSAPPPEDTPPEELAKPSSKPLGDRYLLVPSDSDEDLGEMEAHVGGGAMLGRNANTTNSRKKERRVKRERQSNTHEQDSSIHSTHNRRAPRPKPIQSLDSPKDGRKRANSHSDAHESAVNPRHVLDAGPSTAPRTQPASQSPVKQQHLMPPTAHLRPKLGQRSASATSWIETVPALGSPKIRASPLSKPLDTSESHAPVQLSSTNSSPLSLRDAPNLAQRSLSSQGETRSPGNLWSSLPTGMATGVRDLPDAAPHAPLESSAASPTRAPTPPAKEPGLAPTPPEKDVPPLQTESEARASVTSSSTVPTEPSEDSNGSTVAPEMGSLSLPATTLDPTTTDQETQKLAPVATLPTLSPNTTVGGKQASSSTSESDEVLTPAAALEHAWSASMEHNTPSDPARDVPVSTTLPSAYPIDPRLAPLGPIVGAHGAPHASPVDTRAVDDVQLHAAAPIPYATTTVTSRTSSLVSPALRHAKVTHTISGRHPVH